MKGYTVCVLYKRKVIGEIKDAWAKKLFLISTINEYRLLALLSCFFCTPTDNPRTLWLVYYGTYSLTQTLNTHSWTTVNASLSIKSFLRTSIANTFKKRLEKLKVSYGLFQLNFDVVNYKKVLSLSKTGSLQ